MAAHYRAVFILYTNFLFIKLQPEEYEFLKKETGKLIMTKKGVLNQ